MYYYEYCILVTFQVINLMYEIHTENMIKIINKYILIFFE
jgi:hypothetical protein